MTDADGWVNVAMTDTSVVVELLMQLRKNLKRQSATSPAADLPHNWRAHQRRSKGSPSSSSPTNEKVKAMESTRESPTTPLSWSGGGGSVSGGCAEEEESCKPPIKRPIISTTRATRSKINTPSETTSTKRSKKKKTLPVLREEEKMLLKERKKLKHELATLRATVVKERTTNESLKRIKTAKGSAAASFSSEETMSNQEEKLEVICEPRHTSSPPSPCLDCNDSNWYFQPQTTSSDRKSSPLLPDLNLPLEEEFFPEGLHTAS